MISSLVKSLASTFKGVAVEASEDDRIFVLAPKDSILAVLSYLKENGLDHLALISCVDRQQRGRLELVYILSCYLRSNTEYGAEQRLHIVLKTEISRDDPEIKSAIGVFANAEPYEREIHELFGVHFAGHPRLIPLFLEREYEIPPFRKDFDTREYVAEIFDAIPPVDK